MGETTKNKSNTKLALMLIVGLLLGFVGTQLFVPNVITPPEDAQGIMDLITIRDNTVGKTLTPVCISSGTTVPLQILPMTFAGQIRQSTWAFYSDPNDETTVYAFAIVFGPGSAYEYFVEISRASPDQMTVQYPGNSDGIVWSQGGNEGYIYFQVKSVPTID